MKLGGAILLLQNFGAIGAEFSDPSITTGCLARDYVGADATQLVETAKTVPECKKACVDSDTCKQFAFLVDKVCKLASTDFGTKLVRTEAAISGPKECTEPASSCSNEPKKEFPAATVGASPAAWSSGFQPVNLQCWGRTSSEGLEECSTVKSLETKAEVTRCDGLVVVQLHGKTCEESCKSDITCAAWKLDGDGKCLQGVGKNCYSGSGYTIESGGRFQHGDVQKLMDLKGKRVTGLVEIFGAEDITALGTREKAEEACKTTCYSDVKCQYWNFVDNTGCFVEGKDHPISYPLLASQITAENTVTAGEYVRRSCDWSLFGLKADSSSSAGSVASGSSYASGSGASSGSGTESSGSGSSGSELPWWAWLLLGLLLLCCIGALIAGIMFIMKPKAKKKRAVKRVTSPAPPQEVAPVPVPAAPPTQMVYTVPQPVPTVQRELPVYHTAQPVMTVPQQTYVQQQPVQMISPQPTMVTQQQPMIVTQQQPTMNPQQQQPLVTQQFVGGPGSPVGQQAFVPRY
jgi:uncharacterized membrane protein YgcG